jgi:hypothetical protein
METRFGYDFSGVRVHTDAKAAQSARAVDALAYTVGQDLVFGTGMFEPETPRGRRRVAHELVHYIQQQDNPQKLQTQAAVSRVNDPAEQEAERVANEVVPEARGVEETGGEREEVTEGSLPIEEQVAFGPGREVSAFQPETSHLSQAVSTIPGGPRVQRLCAKSRAEAGYPVRVNLAVPATPAPDHSHDTAWISARAGDASDHTTGLTKLNADFRYEITTRTRGNDSWVTRIRVWLQRARIRIYISNALAKNSCEYNDILRHEQRHDADYRENIAERETRICESAVGWPSAAHPLPSSVLSVADLRTQIGDWLNFEHWQLRYDNWLDGCTWDAVDYPRLYSGCPGTTWVAPEAVCPEAPVRPESTVFPLPNK